MNRIEMLKNTAEALVPWYENSGRRLPWREDTDPYHVWVSEIMLQQTRIETVIPYYLRFLKEIPDIPSLANASPEKLEKLWEGLGYYSRVRNLQKAAQQIMEQHDGAFPETYEEILSLSGIGEYTAGAIASICFDLPTPAVDGNVLRVLSRVLKDDRPISDKLKKDVRAELAAVYPREKAGILTQAIMELGEVICIPNGEPDCVHCLCRGFCSSAQGGWETYPVKPEKKIRRIEDLTVLFLRYEDKIAIRKRPDKGLLAGMWEFPNCSGHLSGDEALSRAVSWGCRPVRWLDSGAARHIFTHVEWVMKCYTVICTSPADEFVWVNEHELTERI